MLEKRLAVLIDADNASSACASAVLGEAAKLGAIAVRRAYGDWTTGALRGWKDCLHQLAVQPVQQFAYTVGKGATDAAMIIDAMDLLHSGRFDGFCLVSSDSDFTRLATRIRESGPLVCGFGEAKTPAAFIAACDRFVRTDTLPGVGTTCAAAAPALALNTVDAHVRAAITAARAGDGWAELGMVGNLLRRRSPQFTPARYGCGKLGDLMGKLPYVETVRRPDGTTGATLLVRLRQG